MADEPVFVIDDEACAGHGRCYGMAPESFEPDDSGYAVASGRIEHDRDTAEIDSILGTCPEEAISLRDESKQG